MIVSLWVRVKEKKQKKLSQLIKPEEDGYCYKIAIWLQVG